METPLSNGCQAMSGPLKSRLVAVPAMAMRCRSQDPSDQAPQSISEDVRKSGWHVPEPPAKDVVV